MPRAWAAFPVCRVSWHPLQWLYPAYMHWPHPCTQGQAGTPKFPMPHIIPTHPQHFLLLANTTHPHQPFKKSLGINHWSSEMQLTPRAPPRGQVWG